MATNLAPDERFRDAGCRYMREQNEKLEKHLPGTVSGEDPEDLHDMRVASRRLRAAMLVFEDCFQPAEFQRWYRRVSSITEALGAVRDIDVQLEAVARRSADLLSEHQPAIDAWISRHRERRETAREEMLRILRRWKEKDRGDDFGKVLDRMSGEDRIRERLLAAEAALMGREAGNG